jgi:lactoylglutathione lyase
MIKIEHIAIWAKDIELMKNFYCKYFNGTHNNKYENKAKEFTSYFIDFGSGCRLELMHSNSLINDKISDRKARLGISHLAISLGSKQLVDDLTYTLELDGYKIASYPRTTGDGYYESCIFDPENNQIELTE